MHRRYSGTRKNLIDLTGEEDEDRIPTRLLNRSSPITTTSSSSQLEPPSRRRTLPSYPKTVTERTRKPVGNEARPALPGSSSRTALTNDASNPIQSLQNFGLAVRQAGCQKCKRPFLPTRDDLLNLTQKWLNNQKQVSSAIRCHSCNIFTCLGCGTGTRSETNSGLKFQSQKSTIICCCDKGRVFVIWALLCALDESTIQPSLRLKATSRLSRAIQAPTKNVVAQNLTGYNPSRSKGIGYGGHNDPTDAPFSRRAPKVETTSSPAEKHAELVFQILASVLPNVELQTNFDWQPPSIVEYMVQFSTALTKAEEYLQNNSFVDIMPHHSLYTGLLDFVSALGAHPLTCRLVCREILRVPRTMRLDAISYARQSERFPELDENDRCKPLSVLLVQLKHKGRSVIQHAATREDTRQEDDDVELLALCLRIGDIADMLEQYGSDNRKGPEPTMKDEGVLNADDYVAWHRNNCVTDIDDDAFGAGFFFHKRAASLNASQLAKGRMSRLVAEIAGLQSSLPEGIYVRHGSSRLDMIKVLIIGPKDTPYENGLFEFDMLCNESYPNAPPEAHFMTTAGGLAHFNPNLYADGKVCLSLLGTWSGEPWRPGVSSLLQVLVSIQSMIFCAQPWCNEPGREGQENSHASMQYNQTIRQLTVRHALLDYLKHPDKVWPAWLGVVETHFHAKARMILETVYQWTNEAQDVGKNNHTRKRYTYGSSSSVPPMFPSNQQALPPKSYTSYGDLNPPTDSSYLGHNPPPHNHLKSLLTELEQFLVKYIDKPHVESRVEYDTPAESYRSPFAQVHGMGYGGGFDPIDRRASGETTPGAQVNGIGYGDKFNLVDLSAADKPGAGAFHEDFISADPNVVNEVIQAALEAGLDDVAGWL